MQTLNQQYADTFDYLEIEQEEALREHMGVLQAMEILFPFGMTFMFIINASTQQYLYLTKNVEHCTGLSRQNIYREGVPFVISRVHPDDRELWLLAIEIMMPKLFALSRDQQLRASFQFNYRFQHEDGTYINIVDNTIPIELTQAGMPYIFFGQASVTGQEEPLPVSASLRVLNEKGKYEELYRVNLTQEKFRAHFTRRENEILMLMTQGLTSVLIAERLFISEETVKTHRKRINAKLRNIKFLKQDLELSAGKPQT